MPYTQFIYHVRFSTDTRKITKRLFLMVCVGSFMLVFFFLFIFIHILIYIERDFLFDEDFSLELEVS